MRIIDVPRATLVALSLVAVIGCQRSTTQVPADAAAAAEATPAAMGERTLQPAPSTSDAAPEPVAGGKSVKVIGYTNVSSGCQQSTVELLKKLDGTHDNLTVELVDFGQSEGNRRWREDGYSCMTILINGHSTVTYGAQGHRRIVTFQYPPGFQWTHEHLEGAINAALDGSIYYGEEAGATKVESQAPTLRITSREATLGGKKVGEVLINGQVAIRLRTTFDGLPPLQRAEQSAARLKRALAIGFTPAQLRVAAVNDGTAVVAKDKVICIADGPQAKSLNMTPEAMAQGWVSSLKKALTAAMSGG